MFEGVSQVLCYHFGLTGEETHQDEISVSADASSTEVMSNAEKESILMVNINDFLEENQISQIDLMMINIEGGEFSLLKALIESGHIKNIRNVQVQFHAFIPNAKEKMESLQSLLRETHDLTWQYIFVFENWRLRE